MLKNLKSCSDLQLKVSLRTRLDILLVSAILWMTCNISNSIWNSVIDFSGYWEHIVLTLDQSSPSLSTGIRQFPCHSLPLPTIPPLKSSMLFLRKLKPSADIISKDLHPNSWLIWPRVGLCSRMGALASITCNLDSIPCVPRTSQSLH